MALDGLVFGQLPADCKTVKVSGLNLMLRESALLLTENCGRICGVSSENALPVSCVARCDVWRTSVVEPIQPRNSDSIPKNCAAS